MVYLVYAALASLLVSLWFTGPLAVHTALALAVMPLILGAMTWFTATLTRSQPARGWQWLPPWLALLAGGLAVTGFQRGETTWLMAAALLAGGAVTVLILWMGRRARSCLGSPHPCLAWYRSALFMLLAGLAAILLALWFPQYHLLLKHLHLHLNLLGLVGLTALATLQVLLPTVAGVSDPAHFRRLHQDLAYAVAGTGLVLASALAPWLAVPGALVGLLPGLRLARAWLPHRATWHQRATPALLWALLGYLLVWPLGAITPWLDLHRGMIPFFILGFLLPLITGATSHLLPLWWQPAPQHAPWRQTCQQRLAHGSAWRGGLFLLAGIGGLLGQTWSLPLAGLILTLFLVQVAVVRVWPGHD